MAFLGFHRRGREHDHDHDHERGQRDWGGERKTLDWGERRYSRERPRGERDIGDYYGPERYGAGPERHSANRFERPEEFGQNRGDRRTDWRAPTEGRGRDYARPSSDEQRWQQSWGPRGRSQPGSREDVRPDERFGPRDRFRSMGDRFRESAPDREPTHGAYGSPERTSFSDFGRRGDTGYGAGHYRGRGPKGYRRSDERIREDVCECLTEDDFIDATNIEVQVKDGEVTLSGTVNSRDEKRRTEDVLDALPGVRDVNNMLRVVNEGGQIEDSQRSMGRTESPPQGSQREPGPRH